MGHTARIPYRSRIISRVVADGGKVRNDDENEDDKDVERQTEEEEDGGEIGYLRCLLCGLILGDTQPTLGFRCFIVIGEGSI